MFTKFDGQLSVCLNLIRQGYPIATMKIQLPAYLLTSKYPGSRLLPKMVFSLLLGLISLHSMAQSPRQTQLWVAKREYFRSNSWDSIYPVTQKLIERYAENQAGLDRNATGDHSIRVVADSDFNSRYGLTDHTEWWQWVPYVAGRTGVNMGQDMSKQVTRERPSVDTAWIKANAQIKSYSYNETIIIDTKIGLKHTSAYGAEKRGVRLSVTATSYQWSPLNGWIPYSLVPYSQIKVLGQRLDCNGEVMVKIGSGDFDVTPVIEGD